MNQIGPSSGIRGRREKLSEDVGGSLELLYDRTYDAATAVATKILGPNSAEDVAQEAMIRAGQKLEDGMPLEEVQELVPIIAYGIAVDEYRSRGEIPAGLGQAGDLLGNLLGARGQTAECADFAASFDRGVRMLDSTLSATFILTELRGLTEREAAGVLSTSQPTVHRRAEAARTHLKEELAT